jgi:hypothetical protein
VKDRQGLLPDADAEADDGGVGEIPRRHLHRCPYVDALAVASDVTREIRNFATSQTTPRRSSYLRVESRTYRRPAADVVYSGARQPGSSSISFVHTWQREERERNSSAAQASRRPSDGFVILAVILLLVIIRYYCG